MTDVAASDFRHPRRYVRLDTILRLRWLAVLGQLAAIFIVVQGLEFDLPIVPCVAIICLSHSGGSAPVARRHTLLRLFSPRSLGLGLLSRRRVAQE